MVACTAKGIQIAGKSRAIHRTPGSQQDIPLTGLVCFDLEQSLALRFESGIAVGPCQAAIDKKPVADCTDRGDASEVPIDGVEGRGKQKAGGRSSDITITPQSEDLRVEQVNPIVDRSLRFVVVEDQDQVAATVEVRDQRCDATRKVGEDDKPVVIVENSLKHHRVGLFEADPADVEFLALEGSGQNRTGAQSIGVVVVEYLYPPVRPVIDLRDGIFHGGDQIAEHHPAPLAMNLSANPSRMPSSAATSRAV